MIDEGQRSEEPDAVCQDHVFCREFLLNGVEVGLRVLDVGCGDGSLLAEIGGSGISASGVEIDPVLVETCRASGLQVTEGRAEQLPVSDGSIDTIVCSVVVPYTDPRQTIAEWARVLSPGGAVNATYHGLGYALWYIRHGQDLKRRAYGLRMLANTLFHRITGRRLPGFWGDTLCQSTRQMQAWYREQGLVLAREQVVGVEMGSPRFLCHRVVKPVEAGIRGVGSQTDAAREQELLDADVILNLLDTDRRAREKQRVRVAGPHPTPGASQDAQST